MAVNTWLVKIFLPSNSSSQWGCNEWVNTNLTPVKMHRSAAEGYTWAISQCTACGLFPLEPLSVLKLGSWRPWWFLLLKRLLPLLSFSFLPLSVPLQVSASSGRCSTLLYSMWERGTEEGGGEFCSDTCTRAFRRKLLRMWRQSGGNMLFLLLQGLM